MGLKALFGVSFVIFFVSFEDAQIRANCVEAAKKKISVCYSPTINFIGFAGIVQCFVKFRQKGDITPHLSCNIMLLSHENQS